MNFEIRIIHEFHFPFHSCSVEAHFRLSHAESACHDAIFIQSQRSKIHYFKKRQALCELSVNFGMGAKDALCC